MNSTLKNCLIVVGLGLLVPLLLTKQVAGQSVGDRIVITADFATKIRTTEVAKVYGGAIHSITGIQGKWCTVEGVRGWLPLQYTMSLESARQIYDRRVRADNRDYDAHTVLGMIAFEENKHSLAIEHLNSALKSNARIPSIWNNRAIVLSDQGRFDLARKDIEQALKLNSKYAGAHANMGLINVATGKLEDAIESFTRAIELDPDNPNHFKNRGSVLQSVGKLNEALADFNRALRIDQGFVKAYIGRANVYLALGKLSDARENAAEAVRLDPASAAAHNNLGWILYKLADYDRALICFSNAIKVDDQMAIAFSNRGVVRLAMQQPDAAIGDLNQAIKMNDQSAVAYSNRANAWIVKREYRKALDDFETALKIAPTLEDALNDLAWFLATCPDEKFRDGTRSLKSIELAIESEGQENHRYLDTYAAALAENGQFAAAVKRQKQAIEKLDSLDKSHYQQRLKLYEQEKPFRSESGRQ